MAVWCTPRKSTFLPPATSVCLLACPQITTLSYMPIYGLGGAQSTRIGNELGANRPNAARLAAFVGLGKYIGPHCPPE